MYGRPSAISIVPGRDDFMARQSRPIHRRTTESPLGCYRMIFIFASSRMLISSFIQLIIFFFPFGKLQPAPFPTPHEVVSLLILDTPGDPVKLHAFDDMGFFLGRPFGPVWLVVLAADEPVKHDIGEQDGREPEHAPHEITSVSRLSRRSNNLVAICLSHSCCEKRALLGVH